MASLLERLKHAVRPVWHAPIVARARSVLFECVDALSGYALEKRAFMNTVGYALDLKTPQSLNQKIVWKKLYDRNPLLVQTSDKFRVRDYVRSTLGSDENLVPLLYDTAVPETIPFETLPGEYVIKVNHDSGGYHIVQRGESVDRQALVKRFMRLMKEQYGLFKHEWAYRHVRPHLIIEALLREDSGDLAQDYKFHVFHGKCRFIHTTPKINGIRTGKRSLFTPEWQQLPVGWKHPQGPYIDPPPRLKDMITIAEKLAAPFDYVRVDLYNPGGHIYFGELTHYHGSGREKFIPRDFDFEAGKWWTVTPGYWKTKPTWSPTNS